MRRWIGVGALAVIGCDEPHVQTSAPYRPPAGASPLDGPGDWLPAADPRSPSVDVALEHEGLDAPVGARAAFDGESILFAEEATLQAVDLTDRSLSTFAAVSWGPSTDGANRSPPLTLAAVGPVGDAVVFSEGFAIQVGPFDGLPRLVPLTGELIDARLVAGGVAVLTRSGEVQFEGGGGAWIGEREVAQWSMVTHGDAVYVATPDAVHRVERSGGEEVADGARHLAVDQQTGLLARATLHRVESDEWSVTVDGDVRGLVSIGAAGVFAAWVDREGDDLVELLDARTGEELGTLDVRDGMRALDGSAGGDLLLQVRGDEAVTWRVRR